MKDIFTFEGMWDFQKNINKLLYNVDLGENPNEELTESDKQEMEQIEEEHDKELVQSPKDASNFYKE